MKKKVGRSKTLVFWVMKNMCQPPLEETAWGPAIYDLKIGYLG